MEGDNQMTSNRLAKVLDVKHWEITEAIEDLLCNNDIMIKNMYHYILKEEQYMITRDGVALLIMGSDSLKALPFKLAYITGFNKKNTSGEIELTLKELYDISQDEVILNKYTKSRAARKKISDTEKETKKRIKVEKEWIDM